MSTLSLLCSGVGILRSTVEVKMHPNSGSWWGPLQAKLKKKKRRKEAGVASVDNFLCARHCDGSVTVGSHIHLFSTITHAADSIVTIAILQLEKLSEAQVPSKCQGLCDVKAPSYPEHVSSSLRCKFASSSEFSRNVPSPVQRLPECS